jgi:hypothetical protein
MPSRLLKFARCAFPERSGTRIAALSAIVGANHYARHPLTYSPGPAYNPETPRGMKHISGDRLRSFTTSVLPTASATPGAANDESQQAADRLVRVAVAQIAFLPSRVTANDRLWFPAEPLLGVDPFIDQIDDGALSLARLSDPNPDDISPLDRRITKAEAENHRLKIEQILAFCRDLHVDLLLFPEYALRPELLSSIIGYSDRMTVVGGVGYMREMDRAFFDAVALDPPPTGTNAAVVIGPDIKLVCTKQHPAQNEVASPGQGAISFSLKAGGRTVRVGLAICLDYIHCGHTFNSHSADLDLVVVPAMSRSTTEFVPRKSRDFVRMIANHAAYGGSGIFLPSLAGPFADENGTKPTSPGCEAITIVDYDRFPSRRTPTVATANSLRYRAQILYPASPGRGADIARELESMSQTDAASSEQLERIGEWRSHIRDNSHLEVLAEAMAELRSLIRRGVLTATDFATLTTHLTLTGIESDASVRRRQAGQVADGLWQMLQRPAVEHLPELSAAYGRYRQAAAPAVPASDDSDPAARTVNDIETLFAISLGTFESVRAVRTLPQQLTLLRAFCDEQDANTALVYRLRTTTNPVTQYPAAVFEVCCVARGASQQPRDRLRNVLYGYVRTTFVGAWSVTTSDPDMQLDTNWCVELTPVAASAPELREDWAALVDQVRRLEPPICLELVCRAADEVGDVASDSAEWVPPETQADGVADVYNFKGDTEDVESLAGRFFARASLTSQSQARTAGLRIFLSGKAQQDRAIIPAVTRELLGSLATEPRESRGLADALHGHDAMWRLRPEEAIRVFHPPYGHIQGRGLRGREATSVPVPDVAFPPSGLCLGRATQYTSREDKKIKVRVDTEARLRHLYVIGKTGSGKTNLLKHLVRQDLHAGKRIAVIDPHGDLVDYALRHSAGRESDVVLLDFGQRDYLPVLNPLDLDCTTPTDVDLAIEELIDIIVRRVHAEYTGPVFEDTVRMLLESITEPRFAEIVPPSVLYAGRILQATNARKWMQQLLAGTDLGEAWLTLEQMGAEHKSELLRWVLAKFSELSRESVLREVLGGPRSTLSIAEAVRGRGVVLVSLPEARIGSRAVSFLGSLIFSRIRRTMFDRGDTDAEYDDAGGITPFFLYVDEFQKFVGSGFGELVAEARKFGLGLTIAHQNLRQLEAFSRFENRPTDALLEALLGNVGNVVVMRTAPRDGRRLAAELDVDESQVARIGQFDALARTVVLSEESDAFTLLNADADRDRGLPATSLRIRERMVTDGLWMPRDELKALYESNLAAIQAKWGA